MPSLAQEKAPVTHDTLASDTLYTVLAWAGVFALIFALFYLLDLRRKKKTAPTPPPPAP